MTRIILILIIFNLFTFQSIGQIPDESAKHPIDVRLEHCLSIDSNYTTYGMMNCEVIARDEWEIEMNKYLNLLLDTLHPAEKSKLKAAQLSWLTYKEHEDDFSGTFYYNMEGTMWRVVAAGRFCEIIRQRALELKEYYNIIISDK